MARGGMSRRRVIALAASAVALAALLWGVIVYGSWSRQQALVRQYPAEIQANPAMAAYGVSLGEPAYEEHCASCHGADLRGDPEKGAPNLTDAAWLYGQGEVKDIERTILYGVRSGHPKSRNITAMPGYGVMKMLPPDQINDVVAYTLSLSVPEAGGDPAVLARGKELFEGAGGCFDCHNEDGSGNPDYGAPALNDADWTFGGDPASVKRSVYDGRRGRCPAFIDTLDFATIRGIALFIYRMSHPEPG